MASPLALYRDPIAMEPLFPSDPSGELEHLATELVRTSAKLSEAMHPVTRAAVAELVRPMNSYYSNLIEGHDTHPLDIDKALRSEYSTDKEKRDRQQRVVRRVDQDLHRPAPVRCDRRPPHLRRHHHRDRDRQLPTQPRAAQHTPLSSGMRLDGQPET